MPAAQCSYSVTILCMDCTRIIFNVMARPFLRHFKVFKNKKYKITGIPAKWLLAFPESRDIEMKLQSRLIADILVAVDWPSTDFCLSVVNKDPEPLKTIAIGNWTHGPFCLSVGSQSFFRRLFAVYFDRFVCRTLIGHYLVICSIQIHSIGICPCPRSQATQLT